jgi:hypothetical protein
MKVCLPKEDIFLGGHATAGYIFISPEHVV